MSFEPVLKGANHMSKTSYSRRDFIRSSIAAGAVLAAGPIGASEQSAFKAGKYHLRYAPPLGWLGDRPIPERLEFFAAQGFVATEENGLTNRSLQEVEQIRKNLEELGMTFGAFVANPDGWGKPITSPEYHPLFLERVRRAVDYHKAIGNRVVTVITGDEAPGLSREEQKKNVIEALKRGAEILEGTELTMALEPLNVLINHKGYFLSTSSEAAEIINAVGSPHVRILFDIYHQQITEGNLINNIRRYFDLIGHFHIGDVPGHKEPGTGEINYRNVFKAIYEKGYTGVLAMEHGLSGGGNEAGVLKCIEEYRKADTW